jgi:hypothetical protein
MSEEFMQVHITCLGDLTGRPEDFSVPIPQRWVGGLEANFDEIDIQTKLPERSKGGSNDRRQALIPTTTIVLKVKPAVWHTIQALAKAWFALQQYQLGHNEQAALMFGSALESLGKVIAAVEKLDADAGEYCSYLTVIQAATEMQRAIGLYPSRTQIEHTHAVYRSVCGRMTCSHHTNGACALSNVEWKSIVMALEKRGVLQSQAGDDLWVAL